MSDVTVRFVGSGDAFGSGGRFQACILVTSGEGKTLIDCGASSLIAMKRCSRMVLTHMSADMLGHVDAVSDECASDGLEIVLTGER